METGARIRIAATLMAIIMGTMHLYAEMSFVCPQDGQFPDASNCRNYFLCWENNATAQQCPHNMLFDVNQAICSLSDEVNCATRQNPDNPGMFKCLMPYGLFACSWDDTAYYYCTNNTVAFMYCPCGTVFDIDQNAQCVPTTGY